MEKSSHFVCVKVSYLAKDYGKLYLREMVWLHGVPLSIISDRGTLFTSQFWKSFQKGFSTKVRLITTFTTNLWSSGANYLNFGRYFESFCYISREIGMITCY